MTIKYDKKYVYTDFMNITIHQFIDQKIKECGDKMIGYRATKTENGKMDVTITFAQPPTEGRFVLCSLEGYYTGKGYIKHGDKYMDFNKEISKAKIYSSYNRAERSKQILSNNYNYKNLWIEEYV